MLKDDARILELAYTGLNINSILKTDFYDYTYSSGYHDWPLIRVPEIMH